MLYIVIPIAALLILYLIGNKSVSASIQIEASQDEVWKTLTDFETIKDWNQVLVPEDGNLIEGTSINYVFYQEEDAKPASMAAKVKAVEPNQHINQGGGLPSVLTFDHHYRLQESEGTTTVTINESYRGIMVPFWNPEPVETAYGRLLNQLKTRVENE